MTILNGLSPIVPRNCAVLELPSHDIVQLLNLNHFHVLRVLDPVTMTVMRGIGAARIYVI